MFQTPCWKHETYPKTVRFRATKKCICAILSTVHPNFSIWNHGQMANPLHHHEMAFSLHPYHTKDFLQLFVCGMRLVMGCHLFGWDICLGLLFCHLIVLGEWPLTSKCSYKPQVLHLSVIILCVATSVCTCWKKHHMEQKVTHTHASTTLCVVGCWGRQRKVS